MGRRGSQKNQKEMRKRFYLGVRDKKEPKPHPDPDIRQESKRKDKEPWTSTRH